MHTCHPHNQLRKKIIVSIQFFNVDHFPLYEFQMLHPSNHSSALIYTLTIEGEMRCNLNKHLMIGMTQDTCITYTCTLPHM